MDAKADLFVERTIVINGENYSENAFYALPDHTVLLAEPGAGKTVFTKKFAKDTDYWTTARRIKGERLPDFISTLVIDGLDEIANGSDSTVFDDVVFNAQNANAKRIVFTCRSCEWSKSLNEFAKDVLKSDIVSAELLPLSEVQQNKLIESLYPSIDCDAFLNKAKLSNLHGMLGNPNLLKMLGSAYMESPNDFKSKQDVFRVSCIHMAKETRSKSSRDLRIPSEERLELAGRIATILLLSNTPGISLEEADSSTEYPYVRSLINSSHSPSTVTDCFNTQLFKLGPLHGQFEFAHRTIMEFLSAQYLTSLLESNGHSLTIDKLLSILSPMGFVRRNLRGLFGWLTALVKGRDILKLVAIDPFAIVANADASLLSREDKLELLNQFSLLEDNDPYFRFDLQVRDEVLYPWLDSDLDEEISQLLVNKESGPQLVELILECFSDHGSKCATTDAVTSVVKSFDYGKRTRDLCIPHIANLPIVDLGKACTDLLYDGTKSSLEIACRILCKVNIGNELSDVVRNTVGQICIHLPDIKSKFESKYFITLFFQSLPKENVFELLDDLSKELRIRSSSDGKRTYDERDQILVYSWVINGLLESLFYNSVMPSVHNLTNWLARLEFKSNSSSDDKFAVKYLLAHSDIRNEIQWALLNESHDFDSIRKNYLRLRNLYCGHAGIVISLEDALTIANRAFNEENYIIWSLFLHPHNDYNKGPDKVRSLLRHHANNSPKFQRIWYKQLHESRSNKPDRFERKYRRRDKRREKRDQDIHENNRKFFIDNLPEVESGTHWGALKFLWGHYRGDEEVQRVIPCLELISESFINAWDTIQRKLPLWGDYVVAHCSMKRFDSVSLLYISALVRLNKGLSIEGLSDSGVKILIVHRHSHLENIPEGSGDQTDLCLFNLFMERSLSKEDFISDIIKGWLTFDSNDASMSMDIDLFLKYKPFNNVVSNQIIQWFYDYAGMPVSCMDRLFDYVIKLKSVDDLKELIAWNLNALFCTSAIYTDDYFERLRFWVLRAFIYLEDLPGKYYERIACDADNLFFYESIYHRLSFREKVGWPKLSAKKISYLITTFSKRWPKVHLPSNWGTDSPCEETAYRFLQDLVWKIADDSPIAQVETCTLLLSNTTLDYQKQITKIKYDAIKELSHASYQFPSYSSIQHYIDDGITFDSQTLKALVIDLLNDYQKELKGSPYNIANNFYDGGSHKTENQCSEQVGRDLELKLKPLNIQVIPEKYYKNEKRCDINVISNAHRSLLIPIEAKGQWHKDLFSAAENQLSKLYLNHPDTYGAGIYLVYWFGDDELIANKRTYNIHSPEELKQAIIEKIPAELMAGITVVVLDVSK